MNDVLIVLNPRRIEECLDAIRTLPIDKIWVKNLTELDIQKNWAEVEELMSGYEHAFIISDDALPRPFSLELLRGILKDYPVVTGYSNLSADDYRVNLTWSPLREPISKESYDLYTLKQVMEWPHPLVPTYYTGFCLTGMSVDLWKRYPYTVEMDVWAGDFNMSKRLTRDGIPILAHREAFVWHVKEVWSEIDQEPRKRLLIGEEPSEIILETV